MRVIEMGNIVYSPSLQRTPAATEAQYLAAAIRLRDARLSALRVEVQRPQCAVAPRGAPAGVYLRGRLPAAYDRQGPEPRHGLVLDARQRMAEKEGLRSNGGSTRRISTRTDGSAWPRGLHRPGLIALAALLLIGFGAPCRALSAGAVQGRAVRLPEHPPDRVRRRLPARRLRPPARPLRARRDQLEKVKPEYLDLATQAVESDMSIRVVGAEGRIHRRRQGRGRRRGDRHLHPRPRHRPALGRQRLHPRRQLQPRQEPDDAERRRLHLRRLLRLRQARHGAR